MTAVEWLQDALNLHLSDGQKVQFEGLFQQAMAMHNEQLSSAYTEGFKRCKYIRELSEGTLFFPGEEAPDDFDTYYEKNYGE